jgi:hypothetical protein
MVVIARRPQQKIEHALIEHGPVIENRIERPQPGRIAGRRDIAGHHHPYHAALSERHLDPATRCDRTVGEVVKQAVQGDRDCNADDD